MQLGQSDVLGEFCLLRAPQDGSRLRQATRGQEKKGQASGGCSEVNSGVTDHYDCECSRVAKISKFTKGLSRVCGR